MSRQKINRVAVHMYTLGTGDCFVLKFMKDETVSFKMLIDCGVWSGKFDHIREFVKTLKSDVENHVNVLVITHEHKDHVFGFQAAEELFTDGNFHADQVWMGWTENDGDEKVERWKKEHGQKKRALALAAQQLQNLVADPKFKKQFSGSQFENDMLGMRANFSNVLSEFADLHVNSASETTTEKVYVGGMKGMQIVKHQIKKDSIHFFSPGDIVSNLPGLEGVKVFVLGPPKLFKDEVDEEHDDDGGSFEHNNKVDEHEMLLSALVGHGSDLPEEALFDNKFISNDSQLYEESEQTWRRIDYDWIFSSGQFALRMNGLTNNLSLALAFEFEESGKVMLFPGDAEFGSWNSWHKIKWGEKGEKNRGTDDPLTTEHLLNRTVFYKVAHHLSHNGTAKSVGLDMMNHPDLVAMATLDYDVISSGWKSTMPNQLILKDLLEKTKGRTIVMNEKNLEYDRHRKIKLSDKLKEVQGKMTATEKSKFENALSKHKHFIEYVVEL